MSGFRRIARAILSHGFGLVAGARLLGAASREQPSSCERKLMRQTSTNVTRTAKAAHESQNVTYPPKAVSALVKVAREVVAADDAAIRELKKLGLPSSMDKSSLTERLRAALRPFLKEGE